MPDRARAEDQVQASRRAEGDGRSPAIEESTLASRVLLRAVEVIRGELVAVLGGDPGSDRAVRLDDAPCDEIGRAAALLASLIAEEEAGLTILGTPSVPATFELAFRALDSEGFRMARAYLEPELARAAVQDALAETFLVAKARPLSGDHIVGLFWLKLRGGWTRKGVRITGKIRRYRRGQRVEGRPMLSLAASLDGSAGPEGHTLADGLVDPKCGDPKELMALRAWISDCLDDWKSRLGSVEGVQRETLGALLAWVELNHARWVSHGVSEFCVPLETQKVEWRVPESLERAMMQSLGLRRRAAVVRRILEVRGPLAGIGLYDARDAMSGAVRSWPKSHLTRAIEGLKSRREAGDLGPSQRATLSAVIDWLGDSAGKSEGASQEVALPPLLMRNLRRRQLDPRLARFLQRYLVPKRVGGGGSRRDLAKVRYRRALPILLQWDRAWGLFREILS